MTDVISLENVSKRFQGQTAVNRLNLSIQSNEIFGLVGPDGAGKTTTMRMLAGVMRPDDGIILIDGVNITQSEQAKARFSYMPQRFGLYEDLTVDENIRFFADIFSIPAKQRVERSERLLAASNMLQFRNRLAGQLSGGMKQKLGLTCALIHAPRIVLLDEPTTGVDPVSRRDFWRVLYELRESGLTIVIATAYMDEAERCHRLALLHQGQLLECDTPQAMRGRLTGKILSLISSNARSLRESVKRMDGVTSVLLVGDRLHIMVDNAALRKEAISNHLAANGAAFEQLVESEPTIEDLFVALQSHDGP